MLKTQVSASLQAGLTQQLNRSLTNDDSVSFVSSLRPAHEGTVNYITFNQDASCVAIGLNTGYKIFNCKPHFGKCFQIKKDESIGIVEMLYTSSLVAVVALGDEPGSSPRKLKLINTKRLSTICDLIFPSTILQVKLTKSRMVVLLEEQIYIYDITTMKLLHTIETSPNVHGLCTLSSIPDENGHYFLAYPSPPKTITHDSLLVTGINTNGGSNSVQNNIQSVSNSPNRVGDVIIFNLSTLQPMSVIEAHKSALSSITLSSNGQLLATASDKGTIVRVFSVSTGVKLYQFRRGTYPTKIYSLGFSSDDRYVVATSSSETVHIFRLSQEEALETKHKLKKLNQTTKKKAKLNPEYETIAEEDGELERSESQKNTSLDDIRDDGDDSDAEMEEDIDDADDDEDIDADTQDTSQVKQRKLSQESSHSYASVNSGVSVISNEDGNIPTKENGSSPPLSHQKTEPIIDQNRLSVARLIRRSSQTLGRKAAQKMGDFLPSRFSSILEPTRHFASLKINAIGKDVKSIAVMNNELQQDFVPQAYFSKDRDGSSPSTPTKDSPLLREAVSLNLLHINVVTSEGIFYTYGLDPERGGDCILLNQYSLLDDGN